MHLRRSIRLLIFGLSGFCTMDMAFADFADVRVCPLEEAIKRLEDYNITRSGQAAQEQLPLVSELKGIVSKAKNPSLPTGAQLSKPDLDRFQQIREKLLTFQAQEVVNSGYLRDSRVIAQSAKAAYGIRMGRTLDEKSPDFFYYGIVALLSSMYPQDKLEITTPRDKECSVEAGLHFNEQAMLREMSGLNIEEATNKLKAVSQRYGLDPKQQGWIEKIPVLQDQQTARIQMGTVEQRSKMLGFVNNMENLKSLARVSVLGYQSDMEDIKAAHNEEELSRVGTGWPERSKKYDERTQVLAGLLNMIAQKVPSDSAIEAQGRTKILQQQGIIK